LDNKVKLLYSQSSCPTPQKAPAQTSVPRCTPSTLSGIAAGALDLSQVAQTPGKCRPISVELRKYRHENQLYMYGRGSGHWASVCHIATKPKKLNMAQTASPTPPATPPPEASVATASPLTEVVNN